MPRRNDDDRERDRDWSRPGPDYEWFGHEGEFRRTPERATTREEQDTKPGGPPRGWRPSSLDPHDREEWSHDDQPLWRGRYFGRGPKGYRRSDERIREEISDRLMMHPDVDASDIELEVVNGIVTLTGTVEDRHQKRIAEFLAEDALGVDDVRNRLEVRHGFWSSRRREHTPDREVPRARE